MSAAFNRLLSDLLAETNGPVRDSGEDRNVWLLFVEPFLALLAVFLLLALISQTAP